LFVATLPSVVVHGGTDLPQEFDVVCLGGGVAGEAIAVGLRDSGLTLAVVERELVGGECPYWGCVPSKTLLRSSETLTEAQRARLPAASRVEWTVDFPKVSKRVRSMARDLDDSRAAAAMEATGARLFRGEGKLTDLRTVDVGREQLIARVAVVIANGSTAAIPPIPRAGEIVGELVLAIKLRIPLKTLADVIHPFPAFHRVLQ
jgi:pyruvate/2-oxoglutarate dehydrogenase complex dihydrolipoamide dehydrogenase (E3) component